jgi:hypothetical protein
MPKKSLEAETGGGGFCSDSILHYEYELPVCKSLKSMENVSEADWTWEGRKAR